ncbi:hypothetical protein FHU36_000285 [Nonomuraea muscovyensis]|uniref:Uncharacterized protein n=1 Tax=Nonomuraea muscovyensis TaxID=1124761 RepID=A0A7X0EWM3_9ACTN|nr:hypothetical protein [Nonomuraea muscovyensis]MBB6343776.1 hypothetical protein [Nonomuraea muscovyensis]
MDEQPAPTTDMSQLIRELAHRGPQQRTAIAHELYRQARLTPKHDNAEPADNSEDNADA